MRALRALLFALGIFVVTWVIGGPVGALLNAPGLLLLDGARRLGILPTDREPSLAAWLWLGTGLSAVFWWLVGYRTLALTERMRRPAE